jgi:hypothetical protein
MSSKRIFRSKSLESGVTPRRLYQVVFPDPGSPIVSTTYPRGDFGDTASGPAGGVPSDSGCVSCTICGSAAETAGANAPSSDPSLSARSANSPCTSSTGTTAVFVTGIGSGYVGRSGASWPAGSSCPLLPVDSDSFGPRLERLLMSVSRIHSRMSAL